MRRRATVAIAGWLLADLLLVLALVFLFAAPRVRQASAQGLGVANSGLSVVAFSALIGGLAWTSKQVVASWESLAQLLILERLSDGRPRTRSEIAAYLKAQGWPYRALDLTTGALAALTLSGRLKVEDGCYSQVGMPATRSRVEDPPRLDY